MEDLPREVDLDAKLVVERLREIVESTPIEYPRHWVPKGTFDELLLRSNRESIHLHPSIHHLHHRWDMGPARRNSGSGRGPKAIFLRVVARIMNSAFDRYFTEEQEFRAALAQSIDAIAYRVDEIATSDEREILDLIRTDLLSLSKYIDGRVDERAEHH